MSDEASGSLLPKSWPGRIGLVLVLLMLASVAGYIGWQQGQPQQRSGGQGERVTGTAAIGGPFTLVDESGAEVTEATFAGKYMLIYFGYTYCPDICPTALANVARAVEQVESEAPGKAAAIQPLFITVDPERDTVDAVRDYTESFHPRMIGLTGSEAQIAEAAKQYRAYYRKVWPEGSSDYLMDHGGIVYLMGPDGRFVTHFNHFTEPDDMAKKLEEIVEPQGAAS